MKLKKLLTMLLTLTMLFSLAACGREEKPAETGQTPSPVQTGEGTGLEAVLRSALYGAREGERRGMAEGTPAPGASVYSRLRKAIEIVYDCDSMEQAERRLDQRLGGDSSMAAPAVSVAIGLFAAADGDPIKTIVSAANVGGDTDTIACIAGAIAGAYSGFSALPERWRSFFDRANPEIRWEPLARGLTETALLMR